MHVAPAASQILKLLCRRHLLLKLKLCAGSGKLILKLRMSVLLKMPYKCAVVLMSLLRVGLILSGSDARHTKIQEMSPGSRKELLCSFS